MRQPIIVSYQTWILAMSSYKSANGFQFGLFELDENYPYRKSNLHKGIYRVVSNYESIDCFTGVCYLIFFSLHIVKYAHHKSFHLCQKITSNIKKRISIFHIRLKCAALYHIGKPNIPQSYWNTN